MDESSEGCYCIQAENCQHWIASITNRRHPVGGMHDHTLSDYAYRPDDHDKDYRPIVIELQRELRAAMLEIEKQTQLSRDLAHVNQELEESRLLAISDQARTAKRLLLMSSQLEYTEQKLYNLTKQVDDGQKDSDLLRIERIKREALQEREDAGRLRIEALQDELQEVQRSERLLQQKLTTTQTKYESLGKRHDLLRQKQQELELARESKEALAWLKETTDRLCSPPQGSLGQAIKQERTLQETAPIDILQSPMSASPPYPSSIMDPPLAAQNQLISLIKELATTNSTLRTELTEYRDLLQDARNEVLSLRSQVEDYEQGHFHECCGQSMEDGTNASWSTNTMDLEKTGSGSGLDPSGSPPPYMTTPTTEQHHHHHIHLPGVRGNVFGELERLYQTNQVLKHKSRHHHHHHHSSSKKDPIAGKRTSKDHGRTHTKGPEVNTTTVSTSTSTSEIRRVITPSGTSKRPSQLPKFVEGPHYQDVRPRNKIKKRNKKSLYTDVDMDMLDSDDNQNQGDDNQGDDEDPGEQFSDSADSGEEPGFVAAFAEALSFLSFFSGPQLSGSPP
ncbi:hypothetical protein BGZ81_011558 [Podila clonocystis]|nr:hypothetical protein BGZ81_011558 [Podila clonocystis]